MIEDLAMNSRHDEDSGTRPGENEIDDKIDAAFAGYVDRLIAGEMLDTDEIVRDHPTIANELLSRLTVYQNVAGDHEGQATLGTLALQGRRAPRRQTVEPDPGRRRASSHSRLRPGPPRRA